MKNKGFTLVEIMIVVAIIALLAAIAIPNLLRARVNANNTAAQTTLRTLSTAAETYASGNAGAYPANEGVMTTATPPYLNRSYCGRASSGFTIGCTWASTGYAITATPSAFGTSGTVTYSITTGGVLTP